MCDEDNSRFLAELSRLPPTFPTHRHDAAFWEWLGRTVASYGFLEEVLGRAIFALTGTRKYAESEIEIAFSKWLPTLEKALSDALGSLIDSFGKAVREHPEATTDNLDELLSELRAASKIRNVLCHASWGNSPDASGKSKPFFVTRNMEVFDTAVGVAFLKQTQFAVVELTCAVISVVTHMGFRFPGSKGPGRQIF